MISRRIRTGIAALVIAAAAGGSPIGGERTMAYSSSLSSVNERYLQAESLHDPDDALTTLAFIGALAVTAYILFKKR